MKSFISLAIALFTVSPAFGAKFEATERLKALRDLKSYYADACKALVEANTDCGVESYKILSRKPTEKWESTVKQIIHAQGAGYVEEVVANRLTRKYYDAASEVLTAGGWDALYENSSEETQQELEAAALQIEAELERVAERKIIVIAGGFSGAFSLEHSFLAIIDLKTQEVVVFNAGYSE